MAEVGFITAAQADEAKKKPIVTRGEPSAPATRSRRTSSRRCARSSRRATAPSSSTRTACRSRPALDVQLQEAANRALDDGLRRIDKRRGFRKPRRNVVAEGHADRRRSGIRAGTGRWPSATSCRRSSPASTAPTIAAARRPLHVDDRSQGLRVDRQDDAGAARDARRPRRSAAADRRRRPRTPRPARSSSRRSSRARCSRSTTAPARSSRWSAATASSAASSTARRRRSGRSARRSSRSSTPRRSIAATRRRRSSWTRRSSFPGGAGSAALHADELRPASSRDRSRCATRSRTRATCRRCA